MFRVRSAPFVSWGSIAATCLVFLAACIPQPTTPPAVPLDFAATSGNATVTLSWSASSGASEYTLLRAATAGGPYTRSGSTKSTTYADSAVVNDTSYYYVVVAANSGGASAYSPEVSAMPGVPVVPLAPANLAATNGDKEVGLSWSASRFATSYRVSRATTRTGPYATVGSPTSTSFTDTQLTNGATYYYVVAAINSLGQSPDSAPFAATPSPPPPTTFGTWTNVTPASLDLVSNPECYGTSRVQVDKAHPSDLYTMFDCLGVWKSTDYGATWTGPINTGTNGAAMTGCTAAAVTVAVNPGGGAPTLYVGCVRGSLGFWRSTDGGINWTKHTVGTSDRGDDYWYPDVDPYDSRHILMTGHEFPSIVESVDGGDTWTSIPMVSGMLINFFKGSIGFVDAGSAPASRKTWLWMSQGTSGAGTWRTTDGGVTWTQVDKIEEPGTSSQIIYQPDSGGVVYLAGSLSTLGEGVLRSRDYGQTWSHVGQFRSYGVVIGTSKNVYAMGDTLQVASQPGTGTWVNSFIPPALTSGALGLTVTNDGTHNVLVGAFARAGLWRYVEP